MKYLDDFGVPNSVYPCTKYLTFGYWIYMVPQYKPESVLMLGYAGGTAAGLIRLIYGDIPITGVDITPCENLYNVNLIQADAREFVKTCGKYDAVLVDLFPNDSHDICDFVTKKDFVKNLARISNYVVINAGSKPDLANYKIFRYVGRNIPYRQGVAIYYFATKEIPDLFPQIETQ